MNPKEKHQAWEIAESREVYNAHPWINVSVQTVKIPGGKVVADYHQIIMPNFAVIFAETNDGRVVMLKGYKHGGRAVSLLLPAGLIEKNESPLEAAQRELLEETGHVAKNWSSLGSYISNANYGCGRAHFFKAHNASQVSQPNSGDLEEAEVILLTKSELNERAFRGEVIYTSMIAAILLATHPSFETIDRIKTP